MGGGFVDLCAQTAWQQCAEYQIIVKTRLGSDKKFAKCTLVATSRCVAARGWEEVRSPTRHCTVHLYCTPVQWRPLKAGHISLAIMNYRGRCSYVELPSTPSIALTLLFYCKPSFHIISETGCCEAELAVSTIITTHTRHSHGVRIPRLLRSAARDGGSQSGSQARPVTFSSPVSQSSEIIIFPRVHPQWAVTIIKIHRGDCDILSDCQDDGLCGWSRDFGWAWPGQWPPGSGAQDGGHGSGGETGQNSYK